MTILRIVIRSISLFEHVLFRKTGSHFCGTCSSTALVRPSSVPRLAVHREIEALALDLIADAQPDEDVDDLEDDQRRDGIVEEDDDDAFELVENLWRVAFDQPGSAAIGLHREDA